MSSRNRRAGIATPTRPAAERAQPRSASERLSCSIEEHAELFDGVRYAIGEFGGFTMHVAGRRFYPIMVAEKQLCSLRAVLRGPAPADGYRSFVDGGWRATSQPNSPQPGAPAAYAAGRAACAPRTA